MKALIELKYIRDYHPEVVNRKLIDEAIEELEALESRSCKSCYNADLEYVVGRAFCKKGVKECLSGDNSLLFYCKYWEARK